MLTAAVFVVAAATTPTPTPATQSPNLSLLPAQSTGRSGSPTTSLAEIAGKIKLRLPAGQGNRITTEDLKGLAAGVELTTAMPAESPEAGSDVGEGGREEDKTKLYWQERYRDALQRVADLEAREELLRTQVAALERDFYSRDDPAQRDGVIKPQWDRALAELRSVEDELQEARNLPYDVLDQARRDGAEPGWFREVEPPTARPQDTTQPEDEGDPTP